MGLKVKGQGQGQFWKNKKTSISQHVLACRFWKNRDTNIIDINILKNNIQFEDFEPIQTYLSISRCIHKLKDLTLRLMTGQKSQMTHETKIFYY